MKFKIGDYVKVIQLTERDNELYHKIEIGDIGIVEFIDNNEIYVRLANNKSCLLYDTQLELYKQRCIESIIIAHGITKKSLVSSITDEIKSYIVEQVM